RGYKIRVSRLCRRQPQNRRVRYQAPPGTGVTGDPGAGQVRPALQRLRVGSHQPPLGDAGPTAALECTARDGKCDVISRIRVATIDDLAAINDIYNHYVLHSTCTFQTEPETPERRRAWFSEHDSQHPVTVLERDGAVVGWGSVSRFRNRAAYDRTVEDSLYVR